MAEQLYGLTSRSAHQVRQKVLDNGGTAGEQTARAHQVRGTTWVKVTGAAVSGWHPGVVSLDTTGTWEDQENKVLVASSDGTSLTTGKRYLCTRTGDDSFDETATARFRAEASGGGSGDVVGPASARDRGIAIFDGTTGKLIKDNNYYTITTGQSIAHVNTSQDGSPIAAMGTGFVRVSLNDILTGTLLTDYAAINAGGSGSSGPNLSLSHVGGPQLQLRNYLSELQAVTYYNGRFTLYGTGGGFNAWTQRYAIARFNGSSTTTYDGIDTTFQVTQSGVTKTVNVVGGIIVGIS
ncbi:unnamed protein product [Gemmata massiliana]|uniref:Uncharacterized protein n=1 Tax=Gemmata massiliana TaxID=1210884 RepID=A0A6P2D433_9BACT|nr:hypothetical protein [Gemmata massiliana]VTR95246.1 unnamed protein product [Gemmata massiliana]